jgi:hypothetical protein
MQHNAFFLIVEFLTVFFNGLTHFTTWGNRGTQRLAANEGRVKDRILLERPLLKSILCHIRIYMLLYANYMKLCISRLHGES